jgi:integrase
MPCAPTAAGEHAAHRAGVKRQRDAFVFSHDPDGSEPWRPDSTSRAFRVLRHEVGLDHVRLHDLRHFVATRLLAAGIDVRTVSGRLGHSLTSTTLNVYAAFLPDADQRAAEVIGRLAHGDAEAA